MKAPISVPIIMLLLVFLHQGAPWAGQKSPEKGIEQAIEESEELWATSRFEQTGTVLDRVLAGDPKNPALLWRLSRACFEAGELIDPEDREARLEIFSRAEQCARQCMEADPSEGECYFWLGAALGRRATTKGLINSAMAGREIESSFRRAVELEVSYISPTGHSSLANAYYALGQFYRLVPDSWFVKLLFGVRGDISKSAGMLKKAVAIEPERLEFTKELGLAMVCHGRENDLPALIEEGEGYLRKVASLPVTEPSDRIDKLHAQMLLDDPSLCCGYSRDGQKGVEEGDLEKLKK